MSSIKISELNDISIIKHDDFFPIVDSGSLTTYRVSVDELNAWWGASGSASIAPTQFQFWNTASNNPNNIRNLNNGNVGINTSNPNFALDVTGSASFSDTLFVTKNLSSLSSIYIDEITGSDIPVRLGTLSGSLVIVHHNTSGSSTIVFPGDSYAGGDPQPSNNLVSDFGYIKYSDSYSHYGIGVDSGVSPAALIIGCEDDWGQDIVALRSSRIIFDASNIAAHLNDPYSFGQHCFISGNVNIGSLDLSNANTVNVVGNVSSISNTSSYYIGTTYSSSVNNGIGFIGTASYAATASYVCTASYAKSSSFATTSSYIDPMSILSAIYRSGMVAFADTSVTFTSPLPSNNYSVLMGGNGNAGGGNYVQYPRISSQTAAGFTFVGSNPAYGIQFYLAIMNL